MFPSQQRLWQVSEELLEQAGDAVDVVVKGFWIAKVQLVRVYQMLAVTQHGRWLRLTVVKDRAQLVDMSGRSGKSVDPFNFQAI